MNGPKIDEALMGRLPLPLAQLYRRAHNEKTPLSRHQAAYYLWEASLKLLGSVAIVEYAELDDHDAELAARLENLARPAVGHWWEFVRRLVPVLAEKDEHFRAIRDLLLGRARDDLPRLAGLDGVLLEVLEGRPAGARSTVRLTELFDHLVSYRNREIGHGAAGQRQAAHYEKLGQAILAGVAELLGQIDLLVGRQLVTLSDISRKASGQWSIERFGLMGENPSRAEPLLLADSPAARALLPERVYLERAGGQAASLRSLHPLLIYDADKTQVLFLNARRGKQRIEYLSYVSGDAPHREEWLGQQHEFMARLLKIPVDQVKADEWAARCQAEEKTAGDKPAEEATTPTRYLGEFELLSTLGQGGMGVVHRAWQPSLGRQVALKTLLKSGDPQAERRFAREIRALGRVEHPHLVKIFTSGSAGPHWFYAMELVEGATLAAVCDQLQSRSSVADQLDIQTWEKSLSTACDESRKAEKQVGIAEEAATRQTLHKVVGQTGRWPAATGKGYQHRIVELIRQVADAAHALHEAGVLHRDIKPGNIIVSADGSHAVLMDLGLAQLADDSQGRLTRTRQFVGTLRYASPEQVHTSKELDRRSDVYSLGVTLWELLTLRPMYAATDETPTFEVEKRILFGDAEPIRKHNRKVPADLEAVVMKCLEKDPARRYPTAKELADDLQRYLAGEPVQARPISLVRKTSRWVKRRKLLAGGMVAALLLAGVAAYGYRYWYEHHRLSHAYYANFTRQRKEFYPIGLLTAEQSLRREFSYKVYRRGGKVEKVEAVNGRDLPTTYHSMATLIGSQDDTTREVRWDFRRDQQGEVADEVAYDRVGKVVWIFHYTTPTTAHFQSEQGFARARAGSGAAYVQFTWSPAGFQQELRYFDRNQRPQPSESSFGETRVYDEQGSLIEGTDLGADGKPIINKYGYARWRRNYDALGNILQATLHNLAGQLTLHQDGYASYQNRFDASGNKIETAYFGLQGQPVMTKHGYHRTSREYDEGGNCVTLAHWDVNGKPALVKEGYVRVTREYNERGQRVSWAYWDANGQPTLNDDGYARWTANYDDRGNMAGFAYFGLDGKRTLHKNGYSRRAAVFDAEGHILEERYFDEADRPTTHLNGYHLSVSRYNERGNRVEQAYFDEADRPIRHKQGYHRFRAEFDERGNRVRIRYLDENDRPTRHQEGYAEAVSQFDLYGNQTEVRYLNEQGEPVRNQNGYARRINRHDPRGHIEESQYFGENDSPAAQQHGVSRSRLRHDERGRMVESASFDPSGRPKLPLYRLVARYDDRGNMIGLAFRDDKDQPARHQDGHFAIAAGYDSRGQRIEQTFLDAAGKPTRIKTGYARWTADYDARGNEVRRSYWDLEGRPADSTFGYARIERRHDDRGYLIEERYYNAAGQPAVQDKGHARWTTKRDQHGNRVDDAYFDAADRPVRISDGYHRLVSRYDVRGNEVERTLFDVQGQPCVGKEGFARWVRTYDGRGKLIESVNLDAAGQRVRAGSGFARAVYKHDERGLEIERAYFNEQDQPMIQPGQGYARTVMTYDRQGNLITAAFFDAAGQPCNASDGYARLAARYEGLTKLVSAEYWGADDKPARSIKEGFVRMMARYHANGRRSEASYFGCDPKLGYYQKALRFDEQGNKIEEAYFQADGKPAVDRDGQHRWTNRFDERGNRVEQAYFGPDNQPIPFRDGYTRAFTEYDDNRNKIKEIYEGYGAKKGFFRKVELYDDRGCLLEVAHFHADGTPASDEDGHHRWTYRYDESDRRVEEAFFGRNGQPARYGDGYSRIRTEYGAGDRRTVRYDGYDPALGFTFKVYRFDERGMRIEEAYFLDNGQPAMPVKGSWHRLTTRYDGAGNLIESAAFGKDGQPVRQGDGYTRYSVELEGKRRRVTYDGYDGASGYARRVSHFDERNNVVETAYFLADGKPARDADGHHRYLIRYDERSNPTEMTTWSVDGQPSRGREGYARTRTEYNTRGQRVKVILDGYDSAKGFDRLVRLLDLQGSVVEESFEDEKGNLRKNQHGYARCTMSYDAKNRRLSASFFGTDGKPARVGDGFTHYKYQYDLEDVAREETYLGYDSSLGFRRRVVGVNGDGNDIRGAYFDEEGKPALHKNGYARLVFVYEGKTAVDASYFDLEGKPVRIQAVIEAVTPGGAADKLGLRVRDVLLTYDGKPISSFYHFTAARDREKPGDPPRELRVRRGAETLTFMLSPGRLGIELEDKAAGP